MPPGGGRMSRGFLTEEEKQNRPTVTRSLLKRIFSYLSPYWKQLGLVLLCITVSSVFALFPSILTGKIMDEAEQNRCVVQAMLESLDQFAVSERVPAVLRVYQEKLRSNMQALIAELKRHDLYDLPAATETPFYCMVDAETEMSGADEEREYCRKRLLEIVSDKRHKKGRKLRKIYFSGQSDLTLFLGGTHPYSFIVDYKSDKKGYTREEIASKYRPQQECYLLISYLYQKVPGYENKMMSQQTLFAPNAFDENKMFRGELKNTDG